MRRRSTKSYASKSVIPANAGIQGRASEDNASQPALLDPRVRGDDGYNARSLAGIICTAFILGNVSLFACATTDAPPVIAAETAVTAAISVPPAPVIEDVPLVQQKFYAQAFPKARGFRRHKIPEEIIRPIDQGNNTYIEAVAEDGSVAGYLRDISAPVTAGECDCAPLNVTLVFNRDFTFKTLLAPTPLTKKDHEVLSPAETQRLIEIVRNPPDALRNARRVVDVVDAVSGATKDAYREAVVPDAALSTRRILSVSDDTQRILQGAPLAWDSRRLKSILTAGGDADDTNTIRAKARALADFIPTAQSPEAASHAYGVMVDMYGELLKAGAKSDGTDPWIEREIEARILSPKIYTGRASIANSLEAINACYTLTVDNLRRPFAEQCAAKHHAAIHGLTEPTIQEPAIAQLNRLEGTLHYLAGRHADALPLLKQATKLVTIDIDPALHLRLADTLDKRSQYEDACALAKTLFGKHPALPNIKGVLGSCTPKSRDATAVIAKLLQTQRDVLLSSKRDAGEAVPTLNLEDSKMQELELSLHQDDKVTVVMFFATWCPHCRDEMPHIVSFARDIEKKAALRGKVRVLGVRTAVEKEREPYAAFAKRFAPNFPIYVDPVMALNFSRFTKSQNIAGGLPTLAVIDQKGQLAYLLHAGAWGDVQRDLLWAVEDLLSITADNSVKEAS